VQVKLSSLVLAATTLKGSGNKKHSHLHTSKNESKNPFKKSDSASYWIIKSYSLPLQNTHSILFNDPRFKSEKSSEKCKESAEKNTLLNKYLE